jgi:glycosyltransferase involved in cell wall biosynthesis
LQEILFKKYDWIYIVNDPYLVLLCHLVRKLGFGQYRIAYDICLTSKLLKLKCLKSKIREIVDRFALYYSNLVVTTSEKGAKQLADFQEKVIIVPNFVDLKAFQRDEERRLEIRRKYGLKPEEKVVGLVGPFDNVYNRHFLRFLKSNIERFDRRIKFLIIGNYEKQEFFKHENVIWTGYVEDYIAHLSALDCLLIPRNIPTEGAMNKAIEAMSLGIPVFTTPIGHANLDYLEPGRHVFVYPEGELPEAINKLLFDEKSMAKAKQEAYIQIERFYSARAVKERLLNLLEGKS